MSDQEILEAISEMLAEDMTAVLMKCVEVENNANSQNFAKT